MSEVLVVAKKSFYFKKDVKTRRSQPFTMTDHEYKQHAAKGLVELNVEAEKAPKSSKQEQSSASPAAQASQVKTASESESGESQEPEKKRRGRKPKEQPSA